MPTPINNLAPIEVEVGLPLLNFVNYARVVPFRFHHRGDAVLRQVCLSAESMALSDSASLDRDWIEPHGNWVDRLQIQPMRSGYSPINFRVSFNRGAVLNETWLCKHDWRVKDVPKNLSELKVEVHNAGVETGDKGMQGALVAEGGVQIGNSANVNIGADIHQTIDSILDQQDANPTFAPLVLELEHRELIDFRNHAGLDLIAVSEGEFFRGSPDWEEGRSPFDHSEHRSQVRLSRPFWMGKLEVTQRQWRQVMGDAGGFKQAEFDHPEFPANGMSWEDAKSFCAKLTEYERQRGGLPEGYIYRLPTETEWEYVCRAGSEKNRYDILEYCAVTKESGKGMTEVAQLRPNDWGFHDMLGNVFEWTLDAYGEYSMGDYLDPFCAGDAQDKRVARGGCFQTDASYARAAARVPVSPGQCSGRIGMRVVLAEDGWPAALATSGRNQPGSAN